jgi:hypothetical protein
MTTALQTVSACERCKHYEPPRFPLDDHWCRACSLPVYEAIAPGDCGPEKRYQIAKEKV